MTNTLVAVIEDERLLLFGYQSLLDHWGYAVVAATSTEEALQALHTAGRAPDAIISDYRLGKGRTGVDAILSIREKFGHTIPAVIVTGDPGAAHSHAAGIAVPVLAKPIQGDVLLDALRNCLSGQNPTPST